MRYALRTLAKTPTFTVTALLTLALTLAAVSTVISLTYALLFRPLDADRPDEILAVAAVRPHPRSWGRVSYADFAHIRDHTTTLRQLVAHGSGGLWTVTHHGSTRKTSISIVSADFFSLLGVKPALGRFFTTEEDRVPGRDNVAVLSHRLWRESWGATPAALGGVVKVSGLPFTIIGVAAEGFHGVDVRPSELYIPTMMLGSVRGGTCDMVADPDCHALLQMIGRVADGRSLDDVRAEVATLVPVRWNASPEDAEGSKTLVAFRPRGAFGTYGEFGFDEVFPEGPPLFWVAGLCLLLGCANLGGLLFARWSGRTRELAIRASLGPTRFRLLRQIMSESLVLAVGGAALGVALSAGLVRALAAVLYEVGAAGERTNYDLQPSLGVIACTAGIALGAGLLFGLPAAARSIRLSSALALVRQVSWGASTRGTTRWVIGAQVAVALALVTLAALLWSSTRQYVEDGHFDPRGVALLRVEPEGSAAESRRFAREVLRRLDALPGVLAVSMWDRGGVLEGRDVSVSRAQDRTAGLPPVSATTKAVAPRYFEVLRTPLLRGRDFSARDSLGSSPVAIVDESFAHRLWPERDPIGAVLIVDDGPPREVVGIVADVSASVRGRARVPRVYTPYFQLNGEGRARYLVRVEGDPAAKLPELVRAVTRLRPDAPVTETMPMTTELAATDELRGVRLTAVVTAYAGLVAVLLTGTPTATCARTTSRSSMQLAAPTRITAPFSISRRRGRASSSPFRSSKGRSSRSMRSASSRLLRRAVMPRTSSQSCSRPATTLSTTRSSPTGDQRGLLPDRKA